MRRRNTLKITEIDAKYGVGLHRDRLLEQVVKTSNDCWEWVGEYNAHGTPVIRLYQDITSVYRYSYQFYRGKIPKGYNVGPTCGNTKCVNPDHMSTYIPGAKQVTEEMVREILERQDHIPTKKDQVYYINGIRYVGIWYAAEILGVSYRTIQNFTDPMQRVFDTSAYKSSCFYRGQPLRKNLTIDFCQHYGIENPRREQNEKEINLLRQQTNKTNKEP